MSQPPWFEDETFWDAMEGFLFSQFRPADVTEREADQILALVEPQSGAAVLDLCCGPGRHVLEFARRGYDELEVFRDLKPEISLGLGVVDIKDNEVETADDEAKKAPTADAEVPKHTDMAVKKRSLRLAPLREPSRPKRPPKPKAKAQAKAQAVRDI